MFCGRHLQDKGRAGFVTTFGDVRVYVPSVFVHVHVHVRFRVCVF
jgi:hypothetical protein